MFWTSLTLLVSSSTFSSAVLPAYFRNLIELQQVYVSKNFDIPDNYSIGTNRGQIYACHDTRLESLAIVRDDNPLPLFTFYAAQIEFDTMFANNIKFDINIDPGEKLTLFCTFPTTSLARRFFRMARGNDTIYQPENLMVYAVETYDDYRIHRESLIPQPSFLRHNFIADGTIEFELGWDRTGHRGQPISLKFRPNHYFVSTVTNGKVVLNTGAEEMYYILYFTSAVEAQQFFEYTRRFATDRLEISEDLRETLNTTVRIA